MMFLIQCSYPESRGGDFLMARAILEHELGPALCLGPQCVLEICGCGARREDVFVSIHDDQELPSRRPSENAIDILLRTLRSSFAPCDVFLRQQRAGTADQYLYLKPRSPLQRAARG